ncbi:hypothetical protein PLICRDRAFT_53827 [Plicaturopsis crispa FD-325 SS-3]|nr:hypothetical protein PLICRDRAFT_53827 [Plicaturopsis crispa FD-325 SS-3]
MLSSILLAVPLVFGASVVAQPSPAVVCVAGQCLQGLSNTTIGATLSAPGASTSLLLLPGQYQSSTSPQLLHDTLTASGASLSPSAGFSNTTSVSLPLNVALQPGLSIYQNALYSGQASFSQLPSTPAGNNSTPLSAGSLALASNVWAAVNAGSNNRVILWNSVPDISQLPSSNAGSLSLLDMQSSSCSPPCSGSGVCTANGTCSCPPGFNGTSCESCAEGFFGPSCQACPAGCTSCDEGIGGTGRCLKPTVSNAPSSCNCLNGACQSNGQCACNAGWTTADNGTACAKCQTGFFQTTTGDCQICQIGCSSCADGTGECTTCKSGFTQDANDRTKCDAQASTSSSGTPCPDGSFSSSGTCTPCSPSCQTCTGATSNDCVICKSGTFSFNGSCVGTDGNGVCAGTGGLIANNDNHECDACGAKCTSCKIPNFNVASTPDQLQCTGCLPGFVLSQGKCVESCPSGTFLSPTDNLTCTACDSSCGTCVGDAKFCLTCANNQLASQGSCVASCPSNTFSSSGQCVPCHPDCATCSGSAFNQCSSCTSTRPVLTSGRCLPTCSQTQFFDKTSSSCQSCDSSCSSCSGSGPSNCLACSSSSQVLKGGSCVSANCNGTSSVVPGLGVCLSDLVVAPQASGTSAAPSLPSVTGLNTPTTVTQRRPLEWWEILLMALGCAFIFLVFLWCWRRRARKTRAKRTQQFAQAKALDTRTNWRWRLVRFGEKLFGHKASRRVDVEQGRDMDMDMKRLRLREEAEEEALHDREMEKIVGAYQYSRASTLPSLHSYNHHQHRRLSADSLYSQVTGLPRRTPEPRQPVKDKDPRSRFSSTTVGSSLRSKPSMRSNNSAAPPMPTDAEAYAMSWREPNHTGGSKNPFRR